MKMPVEDVIECFLRTYMDVFSLREFTSLMNELGGDFTQDECRIFLSNFSNVFELENDNFITRAGAFTNYCFTFKPTKEEFDRGVFIVGDRFMPFIDPEMNSCMLKIFKEGTTKKLKKRIEEFDSDFVLDFFSFYGIEYASQVIASDPACCELNLEESEFELPEKVKITCFDIQDLISSGEFSYGDRICCRVVNWQAGEIEFKVVQKNKNLSVLDSRDLERGNWYSVFEKEILKVFENKGPCKSMEEQLAFAFLENRENLSGDSSGSVEEYMRETTKVRYASYGVETRFWNANEEIPIIGKWNEDAEKEFLVKKYENNNYLEKQFPEFILDEFVKNSLFNKCFDMSSVATSLYPYFKRFSSEFQNEVILKLKLRHDIIEKKYNYFADYNVGVVREKVVELYSKVNELTERVCIECLDVSVLPTQEFVVLSQIYQQLVTFLNGFHSDQYDDDLSLIEISVENMASSFEVISEELNRVINIERKKGFNITK